MDWALNFPLTKWLAININVVKDHPALRMKKCQEKIDIELLT